MQIIYDVGDQAEIKPIGVTVQAAKKISNLSGQTLWRLMNSGQLASTKIGRRRLIHFDSLENLVKGRAAAGAASSAGSNETNE